MLRTLKEFFDQLARQLDAPAAGSPGPAADHALELATAVLLVDVMRAEPTMGEAERDAVLLALRRKFHLTDDELARLLDLAHETARTSNDYYQFTNRLNERFTQAQKIQVIEAMWEVAYADGTVTALENHIISKVAGLLHVTHGEYIAAKLRAKENAGLHG
jgi:uncharacterized tellurite resistance protein B-like protein